MPIVHIHMFEGRSVDQKRRLVESVTDAIVSSVDAKPDSVHIVIHDMARHDYGDGGVLASED
ncbi:MAG: 4-oxalocrotonate tautomerase [Coriobacteriales bacterium]